MGKLNAHKLEIEIERHRKPPKKHHTNEEYAATVILKKLMMQYIFLLTVVHSLLQPSSSVLYYLICIHNVDDMNTNDKITACHGILRVERFLYGSNPRWRPLLILS